MRTNPSGWWPHGSLSFLLRGPYPSHVVCVRVPQGPLSFKSVLASRTLRGLAWLGFSESTWTLGTPPAKEKQPGHTSPKLYTEQWT